MTEEILRQKLEELDVPSDKIDEIIPVLLEQWTYDTIEADENLKINQENELKSKLKDEKDWRKRAKIAAKIISINLE